MNKKIMYLPLLLLAITCVVSCTPEDSDSPLPEDFFVKYYGSSDAEVMIDILPYKGGYLLLGSTNVSGDLDYLLVKTDALGNQIWKQSIGYTRTENEETKVGEDTPFEMILYDQTSSEEGNIVAIIGTSVFDIGSVKSATRAFISLVDVSRNEAILINENEIYPPIPTVISSSADADILTSINTTGKSLLRPKDVSNTLENALIIIGTSDKTNTTGVSDLKDVFISKLPVDISAKDIGSEIWSEIVGFSGEDFGTKVIQSSNNFFIIGTTDRQSDTGGSGINIFTFVVKLDGNKGEGEVFGDGTTDELPTDFLIEGDKLTILGNISGAGISNTNAFILQVLFAELNTVIERPLVTINLDAEISNNGGNLGYGFTRLSNGDLAISGQILGYTDPLTGTNKQSEVLFYKTDPFGVIFPSTIQIYGGVGSDIGKAVVQNKDLTLLIGATIDFQGGTTMMSLIKTNSDGELKK